MKIIKWIFYFKSRKVSAYTLSELLVVLVIIGILVLMALPRLMPLISKARSIEAKQTLMHLYTLQQSYFFEYSKYSANLSDIGFEQQELISESEHGQANYLIEIVNVNQNQFLARATAVVDFDRDGEYNIWEIDQDKNLKEIVKD